jgi:hypothetical protein
MFWQTREGFEPTYLDSEQYYKQVNTGQDQVNVDRFNPTENTSKKYITGYNNPYSSNLNTFTQPGYPLMEQQTDQQEFIKENSLYNKSLINGIPLKDYYDTYTKDVLNNGTWFLNKNMPQETNQYLDNSQVQQKMEIYTGLRQKRDREELGVPNRKEANNLFTPAERITGYGYQYGSGGPGLALTRQKEFEEMKQTIKFKTNEQPFEKIHVGRGIAIGTEVPAAGGFQQYTRIMPDNTSEHTANQLPGMVAGGKWLFSNAPTSQQPVMKNRPDAFYSICQHEPMPGRSTVTAEMTRPDYAVTLKNQNRSFINYGYGVPLNPSLDVFLTT